MVRPGGLELPTFWFVARRSIQLSYGRTVIHTNNTTRPIRLSSRWQLENHANSGPRMGGSQLTLQILFVLPPDINHRRRLRLTSQSYRYPIPFGFGKGRSFFSFFCSSFLWWAA